MCITLWTWKLYVHRIAIFMGATARIARDDEDNADDAYRKRLLTGFRPRRDFDGENDRRWMILALRFGTVLWSSLPIIGPRCDATTMLVQCSNEWDGSSAVSRSHNACISFRCCRGRNREKNGNRCVWIISRSALLLHKRTNAMEKNSTTITQLLGSCVEVGILLSAEDN